MSSLKLRVLSATGLFAFFGPIALISHFNDDFTNGNGIPCIFKKLTGYPCPGCGITRSCAALSHLHFRDSIHFHVIPSILLIVAILALIFPSKVLRINRAANQRLLSLSLQNHMILGFSLFSVAIAADVARVVTGFYPA
jgi:hypothetical protein